ncbi:hypothetical protein GWI33_003257, partial [Rhynchophorus ferrugineus]
KPSELIPKSPEVAEVAKSAISGNVESPISKKPELVDVLKSPAIEKPSELIPKSPEVVEVAKSAISEKVESRVSKKPKPVDILKSPAVEKPSELIAKSAELVDIVKSPVSQKAESPVIEIPESLATDSYSSSSRILERILIRESMLTEKISESIADPLGTVEYMKAPKTQKSVVQSPLVVPESTLLIDDVISRIAEIPESAMSLESQLSVAESSIIEKFAQTSSEISTSLELTKSAISDQFRSVAFEKTEATVTTKDLSEKLPIIVRTSEFVDKSDTLAKLSKSEKGFSKIPKLVPLKSPLTDIPVDEAFKPAIFEIEKPPAIENIELLTEEKVPITYGGIVDEPITIEKSPVFKKPTVVSQSFDVVKSPILEQSPSATDQDTEKSESPVSVLIERHEPEPSEIVLEDHKTQEKTDRLITSTESVSVCEYEDIKQMVVGTEEVSVSKHSRQSRRLPVLQTRVRTKAPETGRSLVGEEIEPSKKITKLKGRSLQQADNKLSSERVDSKSVYTSRGVVKESKQATNVYKKREISTTKSKYSKESDSRITDVKSYKYKLTDSQSPTKLSPKRRSMASRTSHDIDLLSSESDLDMFSTSKFSRYKYSPTNINMSGDLLEVTLQQVKAKPRREPGRSPKSYSPKRTSRPKALKAGSDADISSDDENKIFMDREKVSRRTSKSRSAKSPITTSSRHLDTSKHSYKASSGDSISGVSATTSPIKKHAYLKRTSEPVDIKRIQSSPKRYDTRVYGYMMSTVSSDMKIDKAHVREKREMDNINQKLRSTTKLTQQRQQQKSHKPRSREKSPHDDKPRYRHSYERETASSESKKVHSREGTPVKTIRSKERKVSETKSISRSESRVHSTPTSEEKKISNAYSKSIKIAEDQNKIATIDTVSNLDHSDTEIKVYKTDYSAIAEMRKASPSPTKLKRTILSEHIKKYPSLSKQPSQKYETDKTVQFSDRVRSQSVISTPYQDVQEEDKKSTSPSSLPGSPIRVRSANGGTKMITSEVFTRTQNNSGSIEVVYRQPYENIRRVASLLKNETEMSLIDTTDSSLSESVALPSSPSDHEVSSDANGKFKSVSPTSPWHRKSLENAHRVSDLITCALSLGEAFHHGEDPSLILARQMVLAQYDRKPMDEQGQRTEGLSPILSVEAVSPPRKEYKTSYEDVKLEGDTTPGNTPSVLPDIPMTSHSMASRIDLSEEV